MGSVSVSIKMENCIKCRKIISKESSLISLLGDTEMVNNLTYNFQPQKVSNGTSYIIKMNLCLFMLSQYKSAYFTLIQRDSKPVHLRTS